MLDLKMVRLQTFNSKFSPMYQEISGNFKTSPINIRKKQLLYIISIYTAIIEILDLILTKLLFYQMKFITYKFRIVISIISVNSLSSSIDRT